MKAMWPWFLIPLLIICEGQTLPKKRVCVIGAGRTGLAAVKLMADKINYFELVAFERNSEVGGIWIYRDSDIDEHGLPAHSGIYKQLKTNIPKSYMVYPDYRDTDEEKDSVSHELFLEYLKNYTDHFHLRKYILFDTLVTKVYPIKGNGDWKTTTWHLEMRNLSTDKENTTSCDALVVCNGHFSKPNIPKIPGMETFPGRVLHSRSYRQPQDFANQTVVVLGAGASGRDISTQLISYAKKVYLSQREYLPDDENALENFKEVSGVVAANGSQLVLEDNSTIVADSFIFCTGYVYDYPFLDERSGLVVEKKRVRPLFKGFINVEHPSMVIVGLSNIYYYNQLSYFIKVLLDEDKLPSYEDMLENPRENDIFEGDMTK